MKTIKNMKTMEINEEMLEQVNGGGAGRVFGSPYEIGDEVEVIRLQIGSFVLRTSRGTIVDKTTRSVQSEDGHRTIEDIYRVDFGNGNTMRVRENEIQRPKH